MSWLKAKQEKQEQEKVAKEQERQRQEKAEAARVEHSSKIAEQFAKKNLKELVGEPCCTSGIFETNTGAPVEIPRLRGKEMGLFHYTREKNVILLFAGETKLAEMSFFMREGVTRSQDWGDEGTGVYTDQTNLYFYLPWKKEGTQQRRVEIRKPGVSRGEDLEEIGDFLLNFMYQK